MTWLIDWIKSSIRNKLLLITGGGTSLLLASTLYGFREAWLASQFLTPDVGAKFQANIMIALIATGAAILLAFVSFLWLVHRNIVAPAHQLAHDLDRLASGDFSQPVRRTTQDEIGEVAASAEKIRVDLGTIIAGVKDSTGEVLQAVSTLSSTAQLVVEGCLNQSIAASATAQAVEQVTSSIGSVAENAEVVRHQSDTSVEETRLGNAQLQALMQEMEKAFSAMQQISHSVSAFVSSTATINHMTQQVKDIADQTNLLALNAAIEAARAGEQGRGFAVVADEVRKLAEKSGQSANEIDSVTRSIEEHSIRVRATLELGQKYLESSRELTQVAAAALERTREAATYTNDGVDNISVSVREQNQASVEIARNVEHIAAMAEENSRSIRQTSDEIARMQNLAHALEASVSRFRI
ncbi:MAG: methyl-accepting chemotaxis protein [Methylobacterium sp.]|nr:methyl-accepting chemotaxis protein [Methylobacterium sp.]